MTIIAKKDTTEPKKKRELLFQWKKENDSREGSTAEKKKGKVN